MLTRNLAVELGSLGITINNVAPGTIETPINTRLLNNPQKLSALLSNIPLGRLGQPQDIASLVAFLSSSDADYTRAAPFLWMVDCSGTIKSNESRVKQSIQCSK